MKANETHLARLIEGTLQYLIPHFQRPYTWERKQWSTLWSDVNAVAGLSDPDLSGITEKQHFLGSIVTMPGHSVPEGITKYILIDGQQRLTTLLLLLSAIRDRARELGDEKLPDQIQDLYLINRYQDGDDAYKMLPTQGEEPARGDRAVFFSIVENRGEPTGGRISQAFAFFTRSVRPLVAEDLHSLTHALMGKLILVSIVLERDDNPYAIFESLNAKGQPLAQADLIRNFFFMCIDSARHDLVYAEKWLPMERRLGQEQMTEYIRHFLMRTEGFVKQGEVYFTLRKKVEAVGFQNAEEILDQLVEVSSHYARLLKPSLETNPRIRTGLERLNRLQATVVYPFLLSLLEVRKSGAVTDPVMCEIVDIIENFLIRRYVFGAIRAELNKIFPSLFQRANRFSSLVEGVREILAARTYPSDREFVESLTNVRLYGSGERRDRAKLILERLEETLERREMVSPEDLTIEHVMPQTLTGWWRSHLGEDADDTHSILLHTLGNLTLTGYNPELSNAEFPKKRNRLAESNIAMNREISELEQWGREEIQQRASRLAELAKSVWPNFSPAESRTQVAVRGKSPTLVELLGDRFPVSTWQEVLQVTLGQLAELGDDVVTDLCREFPRYIALEGNRMRNPKQVSSSIYYEAHLNAEQIHKLCWQITQSIGLSSSEWRVEIEGEP